MRQLAQVLAALVEDAAALQQHKPAEYRQLLQEAPAALANVLATTGTAAHGISCGSGGLVHPHNPALSHAASMPLGSLSKQGSDHQQQQLQMSDKQQRLLGVAGHNSAGAGSLRSFLRTLSSTDCASAPAHSSQHGLAGTQGDASGWGRSTSARIPAAVSPHKTSSFSGAAHGLLTAVGGSGGNSVGPTAATPKQSAASKLLDAFRIGKKGREQEEAEDEGTAAAADAAGIRSVRASGSRECSYVLLNS